MRSDLELAYVGIEVPCPASLDQFFGETIGLTPGVPTSSGASTWRNDRKSRRLIIEQGPLGDACYLGLDTADPESFAIHADRISAAGGAVVDGTAEEMADRRVADLKHTVAPWGLRVELVHGLADAGEPFDSPTMRGGFLTDGLGFGHAVFATSAFEASHRFLVDALGMEQSDWIEREIAEGLGLVVRFYHCNQRHHWIALASSPSESRQRLNHLMFETIDRDDVDGHMTGPIPRAWRSPDVWDATTMTAYSATTPSRQRDSRWRSAMGAHDHGWMGRESALRTGQRVGPPATRAWLTVEVLWIRRRRDEATGALDGERSPTTPVPMPTTCGSGLRRPGRPCRGGPR